MKKKIAKSKKENLGWSAESCGFGLAFLAILYFSYGFFADDTLVIEADFLIFGSMLLLYISSLVLMPAGSFGRSVRYIRESKLYIWGIFLAFIFAGIVGFIFAEEFAFFADYLREIISQTEDMSGSELSIFIFLNNAKSSLIGLITGLALGIAPIFVAILNGLIVGVVLNAVWQVSGITEFWRLLPHGVFELFAVFVSLGLGVKLGLTVFSSKVWDGSRRKRRSSPPAIILDMAEALIKETGRRAWYSFLVFMQIVIPLLVLAAIIEGTLIAVGA